MALSPDVIEHLYVAPAWTGHGIGSRLVGLAKERRPHGLDLWTFQSTPVPAGSTSATASSRSTAPDGAANEDRQPDVRYAWRSPA